MTINQKASNNSKMIVEVDKDQTSNYNNTKNREKVPEVPEEEYYTNSKMIVEVDKDKISNNNSFKNYEEM